jgi:hypothetical protein
LSQLNNILDLTNALATIKRRHLGNVQETISSRHDADEGTKLGNVHDATWIGRTDFSSGWVKNQ